MIALASDHAGFELKEAIKKYLVDNNYDIMDFGTNSPASVDYPTFGRMAAEAVASGECDKGIVCCGTGIGISIGGNPVAFAFCAAGNHDIGKDICIHRNLLNSNGTNAPCTNN